MKNFVVNNFVLWLQFHHNHSCVECCTGTGQPNHPPQYPPDHPLQSTKAHYVLSQKTGPTIRTRNQLTLHQAWPSFSVFLKNCDSGNTYSFFFTLLFESSLSGQGPYAPDSCL